MTVFVSVGQIGKHTAEPLVPDRRPLEIEIAVVKLKIYEEYHLLGCYAVWPHGVTSQNNGILHSHHHENLKSYIENIHCQVEMIQARVGKILAVTHKLINSMNSGRILLQY
jgi:hypothetical protein